MNKMDENGDEKSEKFLSEKFRCELIGFPKLWASKQLRNVLTKNLKLEIHGIVTCNMRKNVAYISFKNQEIKSMAMAVLNGLHMNDVKLTTKEIDPAKDSLLLEKIGFLKVPHNISREIYQQLPLNDRIQKSLAPYHRMPYEDQIREKDEIMKSILRKFGNELALLNRDLWKFLHWHKTLRKDLICEVDEFVESPVKKKYCNKCEFTIGYSKRLKKTIVGFRVANYKEGLVEIGPMAHLTHLNEKMKKVVKLMEKYIEISAYEAFDPCYNKGVWRQLTVRTSNNNDVMIIISIHPQEMDKEEIKAIKIDLMLFFTEGLGADGNVTSIYLQQQQELKEGDKEPEYEHVYGKTYIEETILGRMFRAPPNGFLRVNTPACEVLYEKIAELAEIDPTTIVLDICCGLGTIGLSLAENSFMCIGGELSETAVEFAKTNAVINGITNAKFYKGKIEDYMENMLKDSQRNNVAAILNASRECLTRKDLNALRKCEYLNKLVYVTYQPESSFPMFEALMRPQSNTFHGTCFVPIRATPVDLFPDTPHYGLIVVFERYDECKWERIMNGNPRPKDQEYYKRVLSLSQDFQEIPLDREDYLRAEIEKMHYGPEDIPHSPFSNIRNDEWVRGDDRRQDRREFRDSLDSRLEGGLPPRSPEECEEEESEEEECEEEECKEDEATPKDDDNKISPKDDDNRISPKDDDNRISPLPEESKEIPMDREKYLKAQIKKMHAELEGPPRPSSSHSRSDEWERGEDRRRQDWRGFESDTDNRLEEGLPRGFPQECGEDFQKGYQIGMALRKKLGVGQGNSWNMTQNQGSYQGGFNQYQSFGEPSSKKWKSGGQNRNMNAANFNYYNYNN